MVGCGTSEVTVRLLIGDDIRLTIIEPFKTLDREKLAY